jgi:phosphoenolpyruvate-protein kinase (PTS system EI component)
MSEQILTGLPASPGLAAGVARVLDVSAGSGRVLRDDEREPESELALRALAAAAEEIGRIAAELSAAGNEADAEIIETGRLMAADPGLADGVRSAVLDSGLTAADAILQATAGYADALASLDDELLRQRADDVRSLGRRAARIANGGEGDVVVGEHVLVARELGPADVAELGGSVRAVALAEGGTMAHAAIVARSLGIPMVVGVGEAVLLLTAGEPLVVDADAGEVVAQPTADRRADAARVMQARVRARERSLAEHDLPAITRDGHGVRVLANVAGPAELAAGLEAGAEGVGLFRTELRFLEAHAWPDAEEHRRHLASVLACLSGMTATVRLLDFGGDKTPPFLRGTRERGISLLLANPGALEAQLEAIRDTAGHTELRILLPMVEAPEQIQAVRDAYGVAANSPRAAAPNGDAHLPHVQIGAMIETRTAVERVKEIAAAADFLSIGTNDLTHSVLGSDRFVPGVSVAHDPEVLRAIAAVIDAAGDLTVEVCGEAASDPRSMPLLVGLGTGELSVGAAAVGTVRAAVRALDFAATAALARTSLEATTPAEVEALVAQLGDAGAERLEGGGGIVAVGGQP